MRTPTLTLVLAFGLAPLAHAEDVAVTLTVDKTTMAADDSLEVSVQVTGTQRAPQPQITGLENFTVDGQNQASQMQIYNGTVLASINFTYTMTPKKAGEFTIGPATIKIGSNQYQSLPVTIRVTPVAQKTPEETSYYITAEVDQAHPYVNQEMIYTFRLYTRVGVANAQLDLPEFEGFWKEPLGKQEEFHQHVNGFDWEITQIRFALFPAQAGVTTIAPAHLALDIATRSKRRRSIFDDNFFGAPAQTKRVTLSTEALPVTIKPLPSDGKPAGFTGLVGQFKAEGRLSKRTLNFGDSVTLTVAVTGTGNIHDAALPKLTLPDIKTYEDKPNMTPTVSGGRYGGTKEHAIALVPQKAGLHVIEPIAIVFFDPASGRYETTATEAMELTVTGGAGNSESPSRPGVVAPKAQKHDIQVVGSDLMPPKTAPAELRHDATQPNERNTWAGLSLSGLASYIGAFVARRRRQRGGLDIGLRKREKAFQVFKSGVTKLGDGRAFYEGASHLLRAYLGDKLGLEGAALTSADLERKLPPLGISPETIKGLVKVLADCDAAVYGGGASGNDRARLTDELLSLVNRLQKEARG